MAAQAGEAAAGDGVVVVVVNPKNEVAPVLAGLARVGAMAVVLGAGVVEGGLDLAVVDRWCLNMGEILPEEKR